MAHAKTVNSLIQKNLPGYYLIQGKGYCYFVGNDAMSWKSSSVPTNKISDITPEGWVSELKSMILANSRCPVLTCKKFKKG